MCLLVTTEGVVGIDGGEVEMAEVTWNTKKEEREIMFLYDLFADETGWRGRRKEMYRCLRLISPLKNSMNSY